MRLKTWLVISCISVIYICSLTNVSAASDEAILCESCVDLYKAQQVATNYSPPLQCASTFNEGLVCHSASVTINLINPMNGAAYSFNVYHQDNAPWAVVAKSKKLSNDTEYVYKQIALFHRNLLDSVARTLTVDTPLLSDVQMTDIAVIDCPVNTALSTLSDPNKLESLKSVITAEIGTEYMAAENRANLAPRAYSSGYSVAYKGINYKVQHQPQGKKPVYVKTYKESERASSLNDALLFFVNVLGYDENRMPIVDLTLSDASRVAGFTLSGLKGENGPLVIDNECIDAKLKQLVDLGILTMKSSSSSGVGGGGMGAGGNGSGEGFLLPTCTITEFYQSGRHLYTFRKCK